MTRVRELQPNNAEATRALARLNKGIKDAGRVDLSDIDAKLGKIKEAGNQKYSEKKFKEAIDKFSEGINLYLADSATFKTDKDVKLKVTQLYTNRSLSYHQLNDHLNAHRDADHVLAQLDAGNAKALFRRGYAARQLGKYDECIRDMQTLLKTKPANEVDVKKELDEAMKKLVEQQKAKKEATQTPAQDTPKAKIQEVGGATSSPASAEPEVSQAEEETKA